MPRIDANGQVISDEDSSSSTSITSRLYSGRRIDVFGFSLTLPQFITVILAALLMLGPSGTIVFLAAIGAYQLFNYMTSSGSGGGRGNTTGGGGGRKWGANIRGVKDLPKPPKG